MTNNIPKIRFKSFSDSWKRCELWEYTIWDKKFNEVESLKQPKIIKYPYLLADAFKKIEDSTGDVQLLSTGQYIGYTTKAKAGKYLCNGEVVTIPWGGVPNIKYFNGYFVTTDNRIATSINKKLLDNKYLYYFMNSRISFIEGIYRGASIKHPSMNDLLNMTLLLPAIEEQKQIANTLTSLDNIIILHQQKLEKLKNIQTALLEKMFPQNNETTPKIRFKGFSNEWVKCELGEIYKFQYGKFNNNPSNGGIYPVFGANGIIGKYTHYNAENSVVIGHMGEYAGSVIWGKGKHFVTYNGTISKPKSDNIFSKFGYYMLYQKNINKICGGSGLPFLSYEQLNKIEVCYPKDIEEQKIIANYLTKLDDIIIFHQFKLEKLKNIKSGLLEKMFV